MASGTAQSFLTPNYSGMLFMKGNTRTPLSTLIGGRMATTDHVEFVTGQECDGYGSPSQPSISETASLTAPEPTYVTRTQKSNVTQIFQETLSVSYGKMSNKGTMSGVNIANQTANPISELDFQAAQKMQKIANDIEFTFIQGTYAKAENDSTANKTRGLVEAITTSTTTMSSKPLGFWDVADMQKKIYEQNAPIDDLVLWVDPVTMYQLNADASQNGMTIVPNSREVNGIQLSEIVTPMGRVYLKLGVYLPAGTALMLNLRDIRPVEQPTPDHGNFFLEELAKVGAGTKYQIFGQIGLDHGPEWHHGKFTGISTSFTAPAYSKSVFIANTEEKPVHTKASAK